jgi:uncharacterized caspase-like protein
MRLPLVLAVVVLALTPAFTQTDPHAQEDRARLLRETQQKIEEIQRAISQDPTLTQERAYNKRDEYIRDDSPPSAPPVLPAAPALAPQQRALVIGNAAYPEQPLRNPLNDATDMAETLRRFGFVVTLLRDADKPTMERAVDAFTTGVPPGSVGLFFFSGHGAQIEGHNYLLPLGAAFREPSDVKYRAVAAEWILARMDDSGMAVKLLILDACRNNPFGRSWTRALTRGLVPIEAPQGSLIAYATSPGKTAEDGTGRNSPYTAHLLREMPQPQRPIELMFKAVRVGVQAETKGQQTPWEASSLTGEFSFAR